MGVAGVLIKNHLAEARSVGNTTFQGLSISLKFTFLHTMTKYSLRVFEHCGGRRQFQPAKNPGQHFLLSSLNGAAIALTRPFLFFRLENKYCAKFTCAFLLYDMQLYCTLKVREIFNYPEVKTGSKNGALQGRRTAVIVNLLVFDIH